MWHCPAHLSKNDAQGAGPAFLAEQIYAIDSFIPQTAARRVAPLACWKRFGPERQRAMRAALDKIGSHAGLSDDVLELTTKRLEL